MRTFQRKIVTLLLAFSPTVAMAQSTTASGSLDSLSSSSLFDQKLNDGSFNKAPTNIKSDSLSINAKDRVFVYRGNVEVTQADMTLLAKTIEGFYTDQNQIQRLIAKGDVVITKQDIKATSQTATYDAQNAIVTLTDNPQLQQKESVLIADRIKVFLNENRSQAEGSVRVTVVNSTDGAAPGKPVAASPSPVPTGVPSPMPTAVTASGNPPAVTPNPTAQPTAQPTTKPTMKPTAKPSAKTEASSSKSNGSSSTKSKT